MRKTVCVIVFCVLVCGGVSHAQSSFRELTPGSSTRQDVINALGQPVRALTPTLEIYTGSAGIQQIEVEYTASGVVDRIDVVLRPPVTRRALIAQFGLPDAAMSQRNTSDGKLIEYFGAPALVAFSYASSDPSRGVVRIGHYSAGLYAAATTATAAESSVQPSTNTASSATTAATTTTTSATGSRASECFAQDRGIQSTDDSDSFHWAGEQSRDGLLPIILRKIEMLFRCPALTDDELASAYADLSTVRTWSRAPLSDACFGGDRGVLNASRAAHKAFAQSRSRDELIDRMQSKVGAAFTCLRKDRTWQNYLMGDISAAISRAAER